MSAGPTPGPWFASVNGGEVELHDSVGAERFLLYVYNRTDGVTLSEADARLISAAPDLLEALVGDEPEVGGRVGWLHALLIDLRACIDRDSTFRAMWEGDDPAAAWEALRESERLVELARPAIAKAKGETL